MRALTQGSLFTGILGFEQGFGDHFEPRWCAEVDKFCNKIIALRAPGAPNLGDVTTVQRPEPVDVISFGSPCQDLSVAGRRAGLDGARSGLFFEAARIINQCRPTFAVWENVPGAFSSDAGRDFWMVLYTLRELGAHDVAWRVFDSQYAGVPQQRRRIYLVADFRGRRAGEILFDPEGCGGHPAPFGETREGLARSLTRGSSNAGVNEPGRRHEDDFNLVSAHAPTQEASGRGFARTGESRGQDPLVIGSRPLAATRESGGEGNRNHRGDDGTETYVMQERAVSDNPDAGPQSKGYRQGAAYTLEARQSAQRVAQTVSSKWAKGSGGPSGDEIQNLVPATYTIQDAREGVDSKGQNGVGAPRSDTAYTLDTLATQAVAITGQRTHALTSEGADASEDGSGRGTPMVLVQNSRSEVREMKRHGAVTGNSGAQQTHYASAGSTIRRFTPLECERLQGFPDGWTCLCLPLEAWAEAPAWAMERCKCPDGPRYRALGNAVTATVPRWLASRIAACF